MTDTYLALEAATKEACGSESSSEKSSSLVTARDRVFRTAREPMGARYWPAASLNAMNPPWYSTEK